MRWILTPVGCEEGSDESLLVTAETETDAREQAASNRTIVGASSFRKPALATCRPVEPELEAAMYRKLGL